MDWQIIWSARSQKDLQAIRDYVAEHFPTKVAKTLDEIIERVELLKTVPRMGRVYSKSNIPETRIVVCGKYRIFYCLRDTDQTVEVLTVWHHARQEPDLP